MFIQPYIKPVGKYSANGFVACKAFPSLAVEIEKKAGLAFAKQKIAMVETEIVYGYKSDKLELHPGWKVFVDGETVRSPSSPWSRKVYKDGPEPKEGQEDKRVPFILIPESCILLYEVTAPYYDPHWSDVQTVYLNAQNTHTTKAPEYVDPWQNDFKK